MFTYEQVRLIRKTAQMLAQSGKDETDEEQVSPDSATREGGGKGATSKGQISSLVELASRAPEEEEVCLDIDIRWADGKLVKADDKERTRNKAVAQELKALMRQIKKLPPEEEEQLPEADENTRSRVRREMICANRAKALRYVNKLRDLAWQDIEQLEEKRDERTTPAENV
jgi:hypothetical protein